MDKPRTRQLPDDPFLIALTEEERLHGLDLFAVEPGQRERTHTAESETYERIPAYVDSIAPPDRRLARADLPAPDARRLSLVQLDKWSVQVWFAPALAAVLAVVVVGYAIMAVRVARSGPGNQAATLNAPDVGRDTAVRRALPRAPVAAVPAPAAVAVMPSGVDESTSSKTSETVTSRGTGSLPSTARATEPTSLESEPPRVRPDPPVQRALVATPATADPVALTIGPLPGGPALPASPSVERSAEPAVPAVMSRAEASAAPAPRLPAPEIAIQIVLSQYRTAYRELDAGAARAVWPSVDAKALRKAFAGLEQQDVIFDSCQIAVNDARAVASCRGFAWYVPRVGNKGYRDEQRQWEFQLTKVDDAWLIDKVSAR